MSCKNEQLSFICRDIDNQINHIFENIPLVRKDLNHIEHLVTQTFTIAESSAFCRMRNLISNQENLCNSVRTLKDLLMDKSKFMEHKKSGTENKQIDQLTAELSRQQTINKKMKRQVLELNELITDHIQMSRKKIDQRDKEIISLKKKYESLLGSKGIDILIEQQAKQIQIPQRNSLQTIKQEEEINNSNIKTDERQDKTNLQIQFLLRNTQLQTEAPTIKTQSDCQQIRMQTVAEEPRIPMILRTEESTERKSNSKTKVKYFIEDFRRASESLDIPHKSNADTPNQLMSPKLTKKKNQISAQNRRSKASSVLQAYSGESSNFMTLAGLNQTSNSIVVSDSSINHLEVAQNEKDGHWIPYKNTSPKKFDFSKLECSWKATNAKSISSNQSLNDITVSMENLPLPDQSNLNQKSNKSKTTYTIFKKQYQYPRRSSNEKLKVSSSQVSKPIPKNKLSMAMRNHSQYGSANKKIESKGLKQRWPEQIQYLDELDLDIGISTDDLKYEGLRKQGLRHGKGKLEYSSGVFYEGEFKENVRHGYGVLSINGKVVYSGDWQRDKICGNGTIKNLQLLHRSNKLTDQRFSAFLRECWYSGEFSENRFHGNGTLFINSEKIIGRFHDGRLEGECTYCRKDGRVELGSYDIAERSRKLLS